MQIRKREAKANDKKRLLQFTCGSRFLLNKKKTS